MTNGLRVGIVGCGLIGRKRALALREQDSIIGVFDSRLESAEALASELGCASLDSVDALLATEPDVVIVATTHDALATIGEQVMAHGCDVLLEKPGRHPGQLAGKSPYLQAVQIDGDGATVGDIVPVTITALGSNSLFGELADVVARKETA